jgi:hypothetical protein
LGKERIRALIDIYLFDDPAGDNHNTFLHISCGLWQLQLTENTTTPVTSIWLNSSIFLIVSQLSILFLQVHCSFTHQPLDKNVTIPFSHIL